MPTELEPSPPSTWSGRRGLLAIAGGLLVVLAAVVVIVLVAGGGDDEGPAPVAPPTGTLVADGESLLGDGAVAIRVHIDEQAVGRGVSVLSVTPRGFFVGTSDEDRQFVESTSAVSAVSAGQRVDVEGPIKIPPEDPAQSFGLTAADSDLVDFRGGYVDADTVTQRR